MSKQKDIVIFRRWKPKEGGGVIALFPEIPSDNQGYYCLSYERVGQHGGADLVGLMKVTTPTSKKDEDVKALARELTRVGYNLEIREKESSGMRETRRAAARAVVAVNKASK